MATSIDAQAAQRIYDDGLPPSTFVIRVRPGHDVDIYSFIDAARKALVDRENIVEHWKVGFANLPPGEYSVGLKSFAGAVYYRIPMLAWGAVRFAPRDETVVIRLRAVGHSVLCAEPAREPEFVRLDEGLAKVVLHAAPERDQDVWTEDEKPK